MTGTVLSMDEISLPPSLETAWLAELPAARRAQLQSWPDVRARQRSLLGSRLLREALLRLGYPASALLSLRYSDEGKPSLDLPLHFSLAHCEGRILCAFSNAGPVGVDVEAIGALTAADFRLYLTARERVWAGRDCRRFYALWTRKEAVVKAAGTGGLRQMREVEMLGDRALFQGASWSTTPVALGGKFVAHVARAPGLAAPALARIAAETLL